MIARDKLFEVRIMNLAKRLHQSFYTALEGKLNTIWDKVCNESVMGFLVFIPTSIFCS
jgi:hypothetical protein